MYTITIKTGQEVEISKELDGTSECNTGRKNEVKKIYKEIIRILGETMEGAANER